MKHEFNVAFDRKPEFLFGQKLYCLDIVSERRFSEKCPICNDTGKVSFPNVNGDFNCPNCRGFSRTIAPTHIVIKQYAPVEYIINKIEITGSEIKSDYSAETPGFPNIKYYAFCHSVGLYSKHTRQIYGKTDPDVDHTDPSKYATETFANSWVFSTKKNAQTAAEILNSIEIQKLTEFNKIHNTKYKLEEQK